MHERCLYGGRIIIQFYYTRFLVSLTLIFALLGGSLTLIYTLILWEIHAPQPLCWASVYNNMVGVLTHTTVVLGVDTITWQVR